MDAKEKVISLSPLFKYLLNNEEVKKICQNLYKNRILTSDITYKSPICLTLVTALSMSKDKKWPKQLTDEIKRIGKDELAVIVKEFLSANNTNLSWIISNWNDLICSPNVFHGLEWLLQDNKTRKEEQLFYVAYDCVQGESDSRTHELLIEQLKLNLQKNVLPKKNKISSSITPDPKILVRILPMFACELTIQHVLEISIRLHSQKIVSRDNVKKIEVMNSSGKPVSISNALEIIFGDICKTTKSNWDGSLKRSIFETAGMHIAHILDACLTHPDAIIFQWIALNWKVFRENYGLVSYVYQNTFGMYLRSSADREWLLRTTHSLIAENPEKLQQFARMFSQNLIQKEKTGSDFTYSNQVTQSPYQPMSFGPIQFGTMNVPDNQTATFQSYNQHIPSSASPPQTFVASSGAFASFSPTQQTQVPVNLGQILWTPQLLQTLFHFCSVMGRYPTEQEILQIFMKIQNTPLRQQNVYYQPQHQQLPESQGGSSNGCKTNVESNAHDESETEDGFDEFCKKRVQEQRPESCDGQKSSNKGEENIPSSLEQSTHSKSEEKFKAEKQDVSLLTPGHEKLPSNNMGKNEVKGDKKTKEADGTVDKPGKTKQMQEKNNQPEMEKPKTVQGHHDDKEHDLRSKNKKEIEICHTVTCMEPYICTTAVTAPQPKDDEKIFELRVIVDKLDVQSKLFVYIDNLKKKFVMHKDTISGMCFHTFVCIGKTTSNIVYKYFAEIDGKEIWEAVPYNVWFAHVNRTRNVKDNELTIIFDVCSFEKPNMSLGEINSMHARNMQNHLPDIMHLSTNEKAVLSYKSYYMHIHNWCISAWSEISFSSTVKTNIRPSCNAILRKYFKSMSSSLNSFAKVAVNLIMCTVFHKFKIEPLFEDKKFWKKLVSKLDISTFTDDDYKNLHEQIQNAQGQRPALESMIYVLEKCSLSPKMLFLIPLVYILMNDGDHTFNQAIWDKTLTEIKFSEKKYKFQTKENSFSASEKFQNKIKKLSTCFPGLPKLYQELVSFESICHLLQKDQDFLPLFDAEKLLSLLLSKFDRRNVEIIVSCPSVLQWIYKSISIKYVHLSSENSPDKLLKTTTSLLQRLCFQKCEIKSELMLEWTLSLALIFAQTEADLTDISKTIGNSWFVKDSGQKLSENKIKFLNFLVEAKLVDKRSEKIWETNVKKLLTQYFIQKLNEDIKFVDNFDEESQTGHQPNRTVILCFYQAIETYIDNRSKHTGVADYFAKHLLGFNKNVIPALENLFISCWHSPHRSGVHQVLQLLKHPAAFSYLKLIALGNKPYDNKKVHVAIEEFKTGLANTVSLFTNGTISYKNLKNMLAAEDEIFIGLSMLDKDSNVDKKVKCLKELFNTRKDELEVVEKFRVAYKCFVNLCLATAPGSLVYKDFDEGLDHLPWCQVTACYVEEQENITEVTITHFQLTVPHQQAVTEIFTTKIDENAIIMNYWIQFYINALQQKSQVQETETNNSQLSVAEVIENVWSKMTDIFCPLQVCLLQGDISLVEVEKHFFNLNKKEITNLFQAICQFPFQANSVQLEDESKRENIESNVPQKIKDLRVKQIVNYLSIKKQHHNISAFLEMRDGLQLDGNFKFLDLMQHEDSFSSENALDSVTESVITAGNLFDNVSDQHCELITLFMKQNKLVEWLKLMKDRSEVKVMSDLAMISAGESVKDVDRVSCFLSAVMGFAPFLFDLNESSGLEDVLNALNKVWEQSTRDTELLTKWESTANCLEWLKGIKDFHGSVEKSSLLKAQDINTKGIYVVGGGGKVPSIGDCVKLCWPVKDNETGDKDMSLSDLQDLQSRLMLIEDKALEGVDLFISTLSLVENLAQAYVDLKIAGCLLFNSFSIEIHSQSGSDEKHDLMAKVTFDERSSKILCHENTKVELQNLTNVMKEALRSWKKNLSAKRSKFYHLNHYNVQQITYLSQQLAMASEDLPDQVYTLLSLIKHDIIPNEVVTCLADATPKQEFDEEETVETEEYELKEVSETEKRRQIVRDLRADEVALRIAKAGVQQADILDYDEILMWCLENEYENEDNIDELSKQFDNEIGFVDSGVTVGVIENVVKNRSTLSLQQVIDKLVNEQSENHQPSVCINTICMRYMEENSKTSLSDCISLDHLGQFLTNINLMVDKSTIPHRRVPDALHQNVNLLICQEQETFSTLISLYMHSPEQPLPTITEVLVCTDETTQNDVDLLLRRAVIDDSKKGKRIYCLAHTEKLDFEVANSVQNNLNQLQHDQPNDFTLVILCSSNQHFITSLFIEQKVDYSTKHPTGLTFETYLENKLKVKKENIAGGHSALLVTSHMAGLGKSLYISRLQEQLPGNFFQKTVRFLEKNCNQSYVLETILDLEAKNTHPHFVHLDVTPVVQTGINNFLFNLIILGSFEDSNGYLWKKYPSHTYCVEYTSFEKVNVLDPLLLMLPKVTCLSPLQILNGVGQQHVNTIEMDEEEFASEIFQRPYQYLRRCNASLDGFTYEKPEGNPKDCLKTLLNYCSVQNPSWSETRHFASFLNYQLRDCERSVFCNALLMGHDSGLSGFKNFVVKFMIRMSQDFATPSLTDTRNESNKTEEVFELHQMRRSWEQSKHPYLFFNEDGMSMTFLNFMINQSGDLLSSRTNQILEKGIMQTSLVKGLQLQRVNLRQNFDQFSREEKLKTLFQVFGVHGVATDPDPTYELTTDNVLKMLAIHMRFRCDIPVIIMGETGCGKTRMIEFMSKLKAHSTASGENESINSVKNMVVVKVHGGITVRHIQEKVKEASKLAEESKKKALDTILFLDEANTTEAIYAIKEFVCDGTVCGKSIHKSGLNIVAACNPYRRHSEEAIAKMENAGLGFKVKTDDTSDKLGEIPMRCLVYRVIALPPSMHPLVWDFGQLQSIAETTYIEQMVNHKAVLELVKSQGERNLMVHVLSTSQAFMRQNRQECLFVSLRDVERCLVSFKWYCSNKNWLFPLIKGNNAVNPFNTAKCLIHSVGMCYHATLSERLEYRQKLSQCFLDFNIEISQSDILDEIIACQSVFLQAIELGRDIASNEALRENVFMIIMCCEMRIPLFLIGKPGSSKSLSKTIVTDAMQGLNSNNEVFQKLKQIHVLSFQCSPVTDAVGIESVFKQCESLQEKQDCKKFVAVVVLDEIGLAEDSPKMPLKVLHPLLESGVTGSTLLISTSSQRKEENSLNRVGFVGISNWALDPAKMNRGLFVHRGDPTEEDLKLTAKGIFSSETTQFDEVSKIVDAVTKSYLEIEKVRKKRIVLEGSKQSNCDREFFGLRDYYGLLKMIYAIFCDQNTTPKFFDVANAVLRNFSGAKFDCLQIFVKNFKSIWPNESPPDITLESMINANLHLENTEDTHFCESRYLLLMTNHLASVNLLANITEGYDFEVVFGSSFPQDNNYTEKCRNINHIKMCMEAGSTVLLLNLKDLYESLYDALNQHYVTFAGQRYVDLGLGGHRVKCRVHKNFRLVVMEDMDVVYNEFPIPLINRLEKHIFTTKSLLSVSQKTDVDRLEDWVEDFSSISLPQHLKEQRFTKSDAFVGYMNDTAGSAIISAKKVTKSYEEAQVLLLNTSTCDGVLRLEKSRLKKETKKWQEKYFEKQQHDNLFQLLHTYTNLCCEAGIVQLDVTSFSKILSDRDRQMLETSLGLKRKAIQLVTLQQFKTVAEFADKLENFFVVINKAEENGSEVHSFVVLIQCPQAHTPLNLIACAKHTVKNVLKNKLSYLKDRNAQLLVVFLFSIERQGALFASNQIKSFISSETTSVFVDELRVSADYLGPPSKIRNLTIGQLFDLGNWNMHYDLQGNSQKIETNFANPKFTVDLHYLLTHSLSLALTKLHFDTKATNHNRSKSLLSAFFSEDFVCRKFVEEIIRSVVVLAHKRDQPLLTFCSWTKSVALSSTALQEGGSYAKSLWLHLKKVTSSLLAYVISEIDEDQNLDILWCQSGRKITIQLKQAWFDLFHENTLCGLTWDNYDKVQQFVVKGSENFVCQFPFSRKILSVFQKQWELVQHQQNPAHYFHSKIKNTGLNSKLADTFQSNTEDILAGFVNDMVYLNYVCGTNQTLEFEMIQNVIMEVWKQKQTDLDDDIQISSNMAAFVFVLMKKNSTKLKQISAVFKLLPQILTSENVKVWVKTQVGHNTVIVETEILKDALEYIKKKSDGLQTAKEYHTWADLVREIRPTAEAILANPETERENKTWKALAFGALFLEQLVPAELDENLYKGYVEVLLPSSKRLWKGALAMGLNNVKYLNMLIKNLNGSYNRIQLMYLLDWQNTLCKQCKKPVVVDPVILPCNHFMCYHCTKLILMDKQCPTCREKLPGDFEIKPTEMTEEQAKDMEVLSANCASFFLEYLSTLCFPAPGSNTPQTDIKKRVTAALHNLVIRNKETRDMTPLQTTVFDSTPTVRSFILQLLLRYERKDVQEELEMHFTTVGKVLENKVELMMIYIQCIEDSLHQKTDIVLPQLLQEQVIHISENSFHGQLQHLDVAANLRYIVHAIIDQIYMELTENNEEHPVHKLVEELADMNSELVKMYFTKVFCRRYGCDMLSDIQNHDVFKNLVPLNLNTGNDIQQTSMLIVSGENFVSTQNLLKQIAAKENIQKVIDEISSLCIGGHVVPAVLATLSWCVFGKESDDTTTDEAARSVLTNLYQNSYITESAYAVSCKVLQEKNVFVKCNYKQNIISELVLNAVIAVTCSTDPLLTEFCKMISDHSSIKDKFLPTMPQSSYFDVKHVYEQWIDRGHGVPPKQYLCPNGHPYIVGDCGNVIQTRAVCPECKKPIGGISYGKLQLGNTAGEISEATQAGYKLPLPEDRGLQANQERKCTGLCVSVIRFLLHSHLLLSSEHPSIQSLLGIDKTREVLLSHLQKDLEQLSNSLGKSFKDSALFLHQVFTNVIDVNPPVLDKNANLSSIKGRELWETNFQTSYLVPFVSTADQIINEARAIVLDAKQKSSLERLVYEIPNEDDEMDKATSDVVLWNHPALWQYHINITVNHLRLKLSGAITSDTDAGAVLQVIMENQNLHILCYLEEILEIQTALVEKYKQKVDVTDVDEITVKKYLAEINSIISEKKFTVYMQLWNKYRHQLKLKYGAQVKPEYFDEELTLESPISAYLPSKIGRGQYALLLTKFIVLQQNELLNRCREMLKPTPKFEMVKITELTSNDIILIENEQVFLPYVVANSQYETVISPSGSKHEIKYRIQALQKQILQRFILHKKMINDEGIQCIEFLQEVGMVKEFENLAKNVKQEKLTIKIIQKLDELKDTTLMHMICEAVRTLTLVVKHLSKMRSDETTGLVTYIRNDLMLSADEAELIPSSSKLCHTQALFEWFSWQRSLKYVLSNQDPFQNFVKPESCENMKNIKIAKDFLKTIDVEQLQMEINSFLIMKTDLNSDAGLKYYLTEFAEERGVVAPWIDQIPEEICVKHAVHLFKQSAY